MLIAWAYLVGSSPPPTTAQSPAEPVIVEADENGLTLAWTPADYSQSLLELGGVTYARFRLPHTTLLARPGQPELPFYSGLIGLPATGDARVSIIAVEREIVPLSYPPLPAPRPRPVRLPDNPQDLPVEAPVARLPDPAVYAAGAFYPAEIARLDRPQQLRGQRVARLHIYPLRANLAERQMEIVRSLRLRITFEQPASPDSVRPLQMPAGQDPFAQAMAATLLNPLAANWATAPPQALAAAQPALDSLAAGSLLKIVVSEAGLYTLSYHQLQQAGLPVGNLDPRTLRLTHGYPRQEVAILVEGEADGVFHPGDRLLFYAGADTSRYSDQNVFFLEYGQANGLRMSIATADPAGLPEGYAWRTTDAEINRYYDSHYPGRDGDFWYWDDLRQPDRRSASYTVQLQAPLTAGPPARLRLWLQGYTDPPAAPDHRLAAAVNGAFVGEHSWDGAQRLELNFTVPAGSLRAGANQLTLSLPGVAGVSVEGTWLDAFSLTYPTAQGGQEQLTFESETGRKAYTLGGWPGPDVYVLEITDAKRPRRLSGYQLTPAGGGYTLRLGQTNTTSPARYLVAPAQRVKTPLALQPAMGLTPPAGGADYIIVSHPSFIGAIAPLAAHRRAQGLRVATVDVRAIYDSFGPGRIDPEAIKRFLSYAYQAWTPPAPSYVLLVGDGTYDFKNYSGHNSPTFIPPYMAMVDPWWGETAADNQYVTLAGNDALPELLIGRLSVSSVLETETVVGKIIRYETSPPPGDWNARRLFVADNPDSAGDFHADADEAYNLLTAPFVGIRHYYTNTPGGAPYLYTSAETLRTDFINRFNQGAGLVTYHGHSSWLQWAVEGLFRYHWEQDPGVNDVIRLSNRDRLPVVLGMTCFTSFFHHPSYATLDESLVRWTAGGAVAAWGSTGLGVSTGHLALQNGFYRAINSGEVKLGAAALAGKMELYASGFYPELLDTFTLLGDPATSLNLSVVPIEYTQRLYLPIIGR